MAEEEEEFRNGSLDCATEEGKDYIGAGNISYREDREELV
jgi:hypothetical protein